MKTLRNLLPDFISDFYLQKPHNRPTFAPTFDKRITLWRDDSVAGMAESVDAMVSNTIVCKDMPVRVRLPVLYKGFRYLLDRCLKPFLLVSHSAVL